MTRKEIIKSLGEWLADNLSGDSIQHLENFLTGNDEYDGDDSIVIAFLTQNLADDVTAFPLNLGGEVEHDEDEDDDDDFDDDGNRIRPNYELSKNQREFVEDAEDQGFTIDYGYSGRGMYGRECPAIRIGRYDSVLRTKANVCEDSMGLGYVVYAQH